MLTLNKFTGIRTAKLEARLKELEATYAELTSGDEELGGGSPLESLHEEMDDLEAELHRRLVEIS